MSNFEERMVMCSLSFTCLAEIKVVTNSTFVSDSFDSINTALIADKISMDNLFLFRFFLVFLLSLGFLFYIAFNHRLIHKLFFNFAN